MNSTPQHWCYHERDMDPVSSPHRQYFHATDGVSEVSFRPNQCVEGALVIMLFVFFLGKVELCNKSVHIAPALPSV